MKILKSVILPVLIIMIFLFPARSSAARALTCRYAYADLGSAAYFCTEKSADSAVFIIPQTYCVEILAEEGEWYYVKYAEDSGIYRAAYGYCLKSELIPTNEPLENMYLNLPINVTFRTDEINSLLPPLQIVITAAYYGEYMLGKTKLSYVYCNDKFGYVAQTVTDYPLNELPKPATGDDIKEPENGNNSTLVTAVVITVAAVVAIAFLYFSSKRRNPEDSNTREQD